VTPYPRVLHANLFSHPPIGVLNQLSFEARAVEKLGLPWEIAVISREPREEPFVTLVPPSYRSNPLFMRFFFWNWLKEHKSSFDFLLLRYAYIDPFAPLFAPLFPHRATIHHSKEIEEARLRGFWGRLGAQGESLWGKMVIGQGQAVIGLTQEILDYEFARAGKVMPGYVSVMGVDLEEIPLAEDRREGIIKILFIASIFSPWHGLDLILDSFREGGPQFQLHLAGEVPASLLERIKALDPDAKRIIVHGRMTRKDIFTLTAQCDLGLSSFALERINLHEGSTLKVSEYLAQGVPVYASLREAGIPKTFPFYTQGPPVLSQIIQVAQEMRRIPRQTVRAAAIPYIDKVKQIQELYRFICLVSK
jgi:glycosyltransferase involved in cell wall biosynthesis